MDAQAGRHGFDEEEDRPRFCSLDPPSDVYRRGGSISFKEFLEACGRGVLMEVKATVEDGGVDLSHVDQEGRTALHVAASKRQSCDVLAYLLQEGARINERDNVGAVPLHLAASNRNLGGIRLLLRFGAEVNVRDDRGCTPLFAACQASGHSRAILELLKRGADPTLTNDEDAQTPLHSLLCSSQKGKGRPKNSTSGGENGLLYHSEIGLEETVDALIDWGAPMARPDRSGMTALDAAAASDMGLVRHILLERNLELSDAVTYAIKLTDTSIAEELLEDDRVEPCAILDDNGSSLLHLAALSGRSEGVKLLLTGQWLQREGSVPLNIDARDTKGRTALFHAATNAFVDIAAFLLDSGASPAIQDGSGAGVGYIFQDSVKAEQKVKMCELLQQWGARSGEERYRAASSMSVKAPDGEVVYLSGEVPFVHNFKTKHLWTTVDDPSGPTAAVQKHNPSEEGRARKERDQNPWRGRSTTTFQDFDSVLDDTAMRQTDRKGQEAPFRGFGRGGAQTGQQVEEAKKYALGHSASRQTRGESPSSEEQKAASTDQESRMPTEQGGSCGRKPLRKANVGGRGRARKRVSTGRHGRGCSDSQSLQEEEPTERPRIRTTEAEYTERRALDPSSQKTAQIDVVADPKQPGNQHRTLRPLSMDEQSRGMTMQALARNGGTIASTVALSPSAPTRIKPSRAVKAFW
ncbi:unnamed protein product [Scytosiphon promiscuus]